MRGEIQGPKVYGNPPGASFELALFDDAFGFAGLPVWIPASAYQNIEGFLVKNAFNPEQVLARGSQVAVTGDLVLRSGTTNVQLAATRMFPWGTEPGPIESARTAAFASVHNRDPKRFAGAAQGGKYQHASAEQFARAWEGNPPQNIVVLASSSSSVVEDLRGVLRGSNLARGISLEHVPIKLAGGAAAETVTDALQTELTRAADLVVIMRGGGGWRDFAVFDDLRLADAIIEAAANVPVATALGHHGDVSLADIAATASVATPSVFARAIVETYELRGRQVNKSRRSAHGRTGIEHGRSWHTPAGAHAKNDLASTEGEGRWVEQAAKLRDELDETRRNVAIERQRSSWWMNELHSDLRRVAHSRIRVRSFWYAAFGWLSTSAILLWLVASWHGEWPPHKHTWVLTAGLVITTLFAVFVSRADKRAQKPLKPGSKRQIMYADASAWLADARAVRSPRQYRRTLLHDSPREQ